MNTFDVPVTYEDYVEAVQRLNNPRNDLLRNCLVAVACQRYGLKDASAGFTTVTTSNGQTYFGDDRMVHLISRFDKGLLTETDFPTFVTLRDEL